MAGVRTANPQVDIMRFGLSISASTATKVGRISPVAARAGECPFTETDSGCSAGEAKLVFLSLTGRPVRRERHSGPGRDQTGRTVPIGRRDPTSTTPRDER